jgi:hypothetical protein
MTAPSNVRKQQSGAHLEPAVGAQQLAEIVAPAAAAAARDGVLLAAAQRRARRHRHLQPQKLRCSNSGLADCA